jgi:Na+/proline symporter
VSIADALGELYGRFVQFFSAASGILNLIGGLAIQFTVISKILALMLDIEGLWVTVVASAIVIVYSSFGGIKAVTFTDVVQFATFGVFIPVLALTI